MNYYQFFQYFYIRRLIFFINIVSPCCMCIVVTSQSPHRPVGLCSFSQPVTHCFLCSHGSAATPRDKPAPHRQSGPLQWQGVRERDRIGQSCDRDVKQDSTSSSWGIRPHGQGNRGTPTHLSHSSVAFKLIVSQRLVRSFFSLEQQTLKLENIYIFIFKSKLNYDLNLVFYKSLYFFKCHVN